MKSPFPGMDPYIEARGLWLDFHNHLVESIANVVAEAIPEQYSVRTGERSYVVLVDEDGKQTHPFLPDVGVTDAGQQRAPATGTATALAEPAVEGAPLSMRAFIAQEYRERFVEIYLEEAERQLVTCIEVLSPTNKRRGADGWDLYLRKRQGLLLGQGNLVEIDLLRGGQRFPMLDPWPSTPYVLLVARRERSPYCRVWPAHFRTPLPAITVPLVQPDPDVSLNLQPLIETIYVRYRYARRIDYSKPLTPPLGAEETAWLAQQLQARQASS